ncbi:MAG: hypothetical protein QOH56_4335 [Pseudonocardiales bacterium]|jgi:hypothetical protein|nr:hypothetical protein [Pseudonocardiales bacterium]
MTAVVTAFPTTNKISTAIIEVTPDTARRWLESNNTHNRKLSPMRTAQYAQDMASGRWSFNGEALQFDRDGVLLNGQHRLSAIVVCGIPQTFLIVRGLDPTTQITIDQGTRRAPGEQLQLAGIPAGNSIAASLRVYLEWQQGRLFSGKTLGVTTSEVVEWASAHLDAVEELRRISNSGIRRVPGVPSIALAVALRLHEIDRVAADNFVSSLISGANLAADSPVLALRNRLAKAKESGIRVSTKDAIGFYVTAWNAYRDCRPLTRIQRPSGASWTVDNFPTPR